MTSYFDRYNWEGSIVSLDGAPEDPFEADDVAEEIASGSTGPGGDGTFAAVFLLKDGRYIAWDTWWGPTGDGFCHDAYGGDASVYVAYDLETIKWEGLGAEGRRLCGWPEERPDA